jgi:hypothetical protein
MRSKKLAAIASGGAVALLAMAAVAVLVAKSNWGLLLWPLALAAGVGLSWLKEIWGDRSKRYDQLAGWMLLVRLGYLSSLMTIFILAAGTVHEEWTMWPLAFGALLATGLPGMLLADKFKPDR